MEVLALNVEPFKFWEGSIEINKSKTQITVEPALEFQISKFQQLFSSLKEELLECAAEGFLKPDEIQLVEASITPNVVGVIHGHIQADWLAPKMYVVESREGLVLQENLAGLYKWFLLDNKELLDSLLALKCEVKNRKASWEEQYETKYRLND